MHVMALTHVTVPLLLRTHHLFSSWLVGSFKNAQFDNIVVRSNNLGIILCLNPSLLFSA
jgi:hypothetical protein